jgi:DNA transformation protein and related proteins
MPGTPSGRLRPMKVSNAFRDFVVDQLSSVPELYARAMFGGIGLYAGEIFFGLIASDVLYLKVDDRNRADFERAGSAPFRPYPDRVMTMPYYAVPASVVEHAPTLGKWARTAIEVAKSSKRPNRKPKG